MITSEQILKWKLEYRGIYQVNILQWSFIFRSLKLFEYQALMGFSNECEREELLCKLCILYPTDIDLLDLPMGVASGLSDAILTASGWGPKAVNCLAAFRDELEQAGSFQDKIETVVARYFTMPLWEIKKMSMQELLYHYSRAEWMHENLVLNPVQLKPPPTADDLHRRRIKAEASGASARTREQEREAIIQKMLGANNQV